MAEHAEKSFLLTKSESSVNKTEIVSVKNSEKKYYETIEKTKIEKDDWGSGDDVTSSDDQDNLNIHSLTEYSKTSENVRLVLN